MKNFWIVCMCIGYFGFAQDSESEVYNRWSLEFSTGFNKLNSPFTPGYNTTQSGKQLNLRVNHFNVGTRYMFSPSFGFKMDLGYDQFTEGNNSLPFDTKQYRLGVQGVISLGQVIRLDQFTNRFSLLLHGGLQLSQLQFQLPNQPTNSEKSYGFIYGLTPMFKLSNRFALMGNLTITNHESQHYNWDGASKNSTPALSGSMYHISLGVQWYLGKNQKHMDWYVTEPSVALIDEEARNRLSELEAMLQDTDRDGVPDYLDAQNNTPSGVMVDTKGRYYDSNRNGVPDELEGKSVPGLEAKNTTANQDKACKEDAIKSLVEKGYVNVFYDVNQDTPNIGSTNHVYYIIQFLRNYPDAKVTLTGYADARGNEALNVTLSEKRAKKLYDLLVSAGIDASRIAIVGAGVDNTYQTNSTTTLNLARRVSITLN